MGQLHRPGAAGKFKPGKGPIREKRTTPWMRVVRGITSGATLREDLVPGGDDPSEAIPVRRPIQTRSWILPKLQVSHATLCPERRVYQLLG